MVSLYRLKHSKDIRVQNGLLMDSWTFDTMKQLDLHCFRSTKNRKEDRDKAIELYGDLVDLSEFAIHHTFRGLVGLVPRDAHVAKYHNGYFWRLAN